MAYKKDVDDPRESPSFELMKLLFARGASLTYNDPHVPVLPKMRHYRDLPVMGSQELTAEYLGAQDCVLIATDHSSYDYDFIVRALDDGARHSKRDEERQPRAARRFAGPENSKIELIVVDRAARRTCPDL